MKGTSISSRYNDPQFLLDEYRSTLAIPVRRWARRPFRWKIPHLDSYDEYGGIDNINPETDTLFKEGLVSDADISALQQGAGPLLPVEVRLNEAQ